ncbi:MAG: cobalt transport protein CbiN [Candidatus Methanomethylophilus sp.]|nr:cobalt transport protein CbiN [Methanomethylophilus sp.]MDD4669160.1 cobalt transport protein CbiN [Methanomethylophilus sp.]
MKNRTIYVIGFAVIALLVVGALAYGAANGSEFGGSDDAGGDIIADENGGSYTPWTHGIWGGYELPSETESFLFALQAAIGAVIIGFFIGYTYARNKFRVGDKEEIAAEKSE